MTFAFTLLRDGSDYTFIWVPDPSSPGTPPSAEANLCWAKTRLSPHQQVELPAAVDSAAQVPLHLRPAAAPTFDNSATPPADLRDAEDDPLRRLGRVLAHHILPLPLSALLRQLPPATPLLIRTNETELPWELLHDDHGFLALRHAVARHMIFAEPIQAAPMRPPRGGRCLLIGNPNDNLPAADQEIEKLLDLLDMAPTPLRVEFLCREHATKLRVLTALASGDYAVIHFACHARPGALSLADGWLHAEEIRTVLRGNPLVFLNACSSGRRQLFPTDALPLAGEQTHSLAHAFLAGGAAAFLGTLWPIDDGEIHWLALEFYRALCQGQGVGAALHQARNRSYQRAPHAGAWAAPVLYGDPDFRLPAPPARAQPATVLAVHLHPHAQDASSEALPLFLAEAATYLTAQGGSLVTLHPRRMCAVFGLPGALEDDAVRATQAAMELRRMAEVHHLVLSAAVAGGEITLVAPPAPAWPLYLGHALLEAEDLAAQGRAGQVLVNALARRLGDTRFAYTPADPITGTLTDTDIYEVAPLAVPEPTAPTTQPAVLRAPGQLVGRARELALLAGYWQGAVAGRGCVVGIAGDAGIGKTRLLQALHHTLMQPDSLAHPTMPRPFTWISLACAATGQERPYMLVGQLLRHIFGIGPDADSEDVAAKIAQSLDARPAIQSLVDPQLHQILRETLGYATSELPLEERKARRGRLVHLLRTLMADAVRTRPLLIAIDDAHWADEASLEILAQVTDGISRLPVQFVVLYRPEWQVGWFDKAYYRYLPLEELDEVSSIELICMLLQTDTLPKGLSPLLQKTGGNPFFIAEMVKFLLERAILVRRPPNGGRAPGGEWELQRPLTGSQLPDTVQRVIRVRLERLTTATRQVLELAAVIGPTFQPALLAHLTETHDQPLESHLAELEQRGFIEARWQLQDYRFCHALILDTVYQALLPTLRQTWHRRIAETLEAGEPTGHVQHNVEALAHHFYHSLLVSLPTEATRLDAGAAPSQVAKALAYLYQAGTRAQERYAAREAINYFRRGLLLLPLLADRQTLEIALREGLGDAYNTLGNFDLACQALRQAYATLHAQPLARADCRRAADLARRIGRLCAWQGEHEAGLHWMQQGLRELGDLVEAADRATAALLHIHMGAVHYNKGDLDATLHLCQAGLALAEAGQATEAWAEGHNLLGVVFSSMRQNRRALEHYRQSLQLWETHGNRYQAMRVAGNIGVVYYDEGNLAEAQAYYAQGLDYLEQIEDQDRLAYRRLNLGNVHLCRGEWQQAQASFETALALWEEMNNQRWIALCHTNLGLLALEQANWAGAHARLTTSHDLLTRLDIRDMLPEVYYSLAEVALGRGEPTQALTLARQAVDLASVLEMPFEGALAQRAEGRALAALGCMDEARACLEAAVATLRTLESRFELGRTLAGLATLCAGRDDMQTARAAGTEAAQIFAQMGAAHEQAKLQAWATHSAPVMLDGASA